MSAANELKQDIAERFYDQLRERRSILDYGFNENEKPLPVIGGWPIGASGYPFKDFNALQLMTVALDRGFTSPIYMKSEQIKKMATTSPKAKAKPQRLKAPISKKTVKSSP